MAKKPDTSAKPRWHGVLHTLPHGSFTARADGRRYLVSKSAYAGGKSVKLVARALDGSDYISLNLYDLSSGPRLKPCEMPATKVIAFLESLMPEI